MVNQNFGSTMISSKRMKFGLLQIDRTLPHLPPTLANTLQQFDILLGDEHPFRELPNIL